MVHVEGAPEMTRSLREIAEIAYGEPAPAAAPAWSPGSRRSIRYQPPPMTFTSAAHACVVEVDAETGFVKILRWICSEDCGIVINPAVVEGQIAGGLAQAIGTVLLEDMHYRRARQPDDGDVQGLSAAGDHRRAGLRVHPRHHAVEEPTAASAASAKAARSSARRRWSTPSPTRWRRSANCLELPLTPSKLLDVIDRGRAAAPA